MASLNLTLPVLGVYPHCGGGQVQGWLCQLEPGQTQIQLTTMLITHPFQYYTKCTTGPTNPFHGAISFDNIGLAWVAIFLV